MICRLHFANEAALSLYVIFYDMTLSIRLALCFYPHLQDCSGRDCLVAGFTTTCAITAYQH